jgi:hypothetical protein
MWWSKTKKFLHEHKYKLLTGAGVLLASAFLYSYATDESLIKLSSFITALK